MVHLVAVSAFQRREHLRNITSHYSASEIGERIDAANKVCGARLRKTSALAALKRKIAQCEHT